MEQRRPGPVVGVGTYETLDAGAGTTREYVARLARAG